MATTWKPLIEAFKMNGIIYYRLQGPKQSREPSCWHRHRADLMHKRDTYLEGHQTAHEAKIIGSISWTGRATFKVKMWGTCSKHTPGRNSVENISNVCPQHTLVFFFLGIPQGNSNLLSRDAAINSPWILIVLLIIPLIHPPCSFTHPTLKSVYQPALWHNQPHSGKSAWTCVSSHSLLQGGSSGNTQSRKLHTPQNWIVCVGHSSFSVAETAIICGSNL